MIKNNVQIVYIYFYKNMKEFTAKDLVENFDDFDGSYDYNEKNLTVVGYDESGKTWILDVEGDIIREGKVNFSDDCLLGEGYNIDDARKDTDSILLADLDFKYQGTLIWDSFPLMEIFAD